MKTAGLETTDIFRGAFYLCMGGDLSGIRFKANGRQIATFHFSGPESLTGMTKPISTAMHWSIRFSSEKR